MEGEQKSGNKARVAEQKNAFNLYVRTDKLDSSNDRNLNKA